MMTYMVIKSLHLIVITLWIGGMLMLALAMNVWRKMPANVNEAPSPLLLAMQRWNQRITMPAMLLVWVTGLALTLMGNWPPSASLLLKGVFVLLLSAIHGMQSGSLRRSLAQKRLVAPAVLNYAAGITLIALVASVLLIELKPF